MTTPLRTTASAVLAVLRDCDRETGAMAQQTGLACPPGCGACCENPAVAATPAELLPLALAAMDRGDAVELLARARAHQGGWCVFYAPTSVGQGRCTQYAWRPVVCRLFGFSGVRSKRGLELAVCWQLHEAQPATMVQAQQDVEDGRIPMPVFEDLHRRVAVLSGALDHPSQPINTALCVALEHVLGER